VIERLAFGRTACRGRLVAGVAGAAGADADFDLNDPAASPLARSVAGIFTPLNCTVI
jgi:hypothetical protein